MEAFSDGIFAFAATLLVLDLASSSWTLFGMVCAWVAFAVAGRTALSLRFVAWTTSTCRAAARSVAASTDRDHAAGAGREKMR